jgi:hypothetical protein
VERVMSLEPYASARTVYWVIDNGSSHNGQRSVDRMTAAFPNGRLVHLPVRASWLNQIEIVFSVSTAPAASTSTTQPHGSPIHRRTNARYH